jgi:hypothetical protein
MKRNSYTKYTLAVLIFLFITLLVIYLKSAGNRLTFEEQHPEQIVAEELARLHQTYRIGTSSFSLDYAAHMKYGYANCKEFALILKDQLANLGYASRRVGLMTKSGDAHDLLEVNLRGKWVLVDAMSNVMYQDSFIDILTNPQLASRATFPDNFNQELLRLTQPSFFASASTVDLGTEYISDPYRWHQYEHADPSVLNQDSALWCKTTECTWEIGPLETLTYHNTRSDFVILKVEINGRYPTVKDDQSVEFIKTSVGGVFLPRLFRLSDGRLKLTTSASGPHGLSAWVLGKPIQSISDLQMRVPIPSVMVFRRNPINFYSAQLLENDTVIWSKLSSTLDQEQFYSAFFLAVPPERSAWSGPHKDNAGSIYFNSVLDLPSNEPRIRVQPVVRTEKQPASYKLQIMYKSQSDVDLLIYSENSKKLYELSTLDPCLNDPCRRVINLDNDVVLDILNRTE